ncbi:MAG: NAD(P)-dependent oxidoreductase [Anaerovoracaceae bacterium]
MAKIKCTLPPAFVKRFGDVKPEGMDFEFINYPCSDEELVEQCKDADIIFCGPVDPISGDVVKQLPNLKLIHSLGVGFDKIDLEVTKERGVYVCNNRAVNALAVAEHAVGMMMASLKKTAYYDSKVKSDKTGYLTYKNKGGRELGARTVGLIGLGAIGHAAVKMLSSFGCKILYTDVVRADEAFEKEWNLTYVDHETLYKECDILSYHVPVLDSTRGMINKENIAKMKQDVILVNVSRGEIVNDEDLKEALEAGKVIAALDVVAPEPGTPEDDHILFHLNEEGNSRLTLTPHIAGTTDEAFFRMYEWSYAAMVKVMAGEKPNNVVNGL